MDLACTLCLQEIEIAIVKALLVTLPLGFAALTFSDLARKSFSESDRV